MATTLQSFPNYINGQAIDATDAAPVLGDGVFTRFEA